MAMPKMPYCTATRKEQSITIAASKENLKLTIDFPKALRSTKATPAKDCKTATKHKHIKG